MIKTVLVIEDNEDIRTNVVELLELALYKVIQAENGKIGVDYALKYIPDIILCDVMMPVLDGFGVLHILNKHKSTSGIPFIFLSARAEHSDLRKGMELGADDYLIKPFDDLELLNAIETRLKKKGSVENLNPTSSHQSKLITAKINGLNEFNKIIAAGKARDFKKNQVVYAETDHGRGIYLIISGKVKTIKLAEDGRELMTGLYSAGDYIGINAILINSVYTETATTIEESRLAMISIEEMETVLNLYPEVARKFINLLSRDNQEKEELLLQLAYHSVRKKMAETIIKLHTQTSNQKGFFTISRENLAAMACIAMETVSRTLSDFKQEKLIAREGNVITVLNLEGLSKMKN